MSLPAGYRFHHQGWYYKTENGEGPFFIDAQGRPHQGAGWGELTADAWGSPKVSVPFSVFHGLFTFDLPPSQWFMYHGSTQVYTSANIISTGGAAVITANAAVPVALLESRATPRYQPNRGHLFSTACWAPDSTADGIREWGLATAENGVFFRLKADGELYAVRRAGGVERAEELIDTSRVPGFDVERGNVYDIQYQWRGVGNYVFYINLTQVHVFSLLGTLMELSIQDPALAAYFKVTRTTEDVALSVGCADISSENGGSDRLQYGSVYASATLSGTNTPLVVIASPLQVASVTNTRMLELARISLTSDKRGVFKVWSTRDPAAIIGATLQPVGGGSIVRTDSDDAAPGAVKATSINTALCKLITSIPILPNVHSVTVNPFQERIDFPLVRGDYLIITGTLTSAACEAVVEYGEAI